MTSVRPQFIQVNQPTSHISITISDPQAQADLQLVLIRHRQAYRLSRLFAYRLTRSACCRGAVAAGRGLSLQHSLLQYVLCNTLGPAIGVVCLDMGLSMLKVQLSKMRSLASSQAFKPRLVPSCALELVDRYRETAQTARWLTVFTRSEVVDVARPVLWTTETSVGGS